MRMDIPVYKNQTLELKISSVNSESSGVAHVDGYTVFVPGALQGETVSALIIKVNPRFAVAKLLKVLTRTADRVDPTCPVFPFCGGCSLLHLDYKTQLELKRQTVQDALKHIGGLEQIEVLPVKGMDEPYRYRNKGSFPFAFTPDGNTSFGFFAPRSHRLIPIFDCQIQDVRIIRILNAVLEWARKYRIPPYDETTGKGILRHLVCRVTSLGQAMAVIVTTGQLPHKKELLEMLSFVDSVWQNINTRKTNAIFGINFIHLAGEKKLSHELCGLQFSVGPNSFLQVNSSQTEVLYTEAINRLNPSDKESVLDAYCGIGTMSLLLARSALQVTGVEIVPEAIENARQNASLNHTENVSFVCESVENYIKQANFDVLMLDPPRKGCDPAVIHSILEKGVSRIVYVSCNPATLARDIGLLLPDYSVSSIQPVDMFPHTRHVETVCSLYHQKKDSISGPYEPKNADYSKLQK